MAYGQTGSGKTFTMGSEAHVEPEASSQAGLIPRFITDFFNEMQRKKAASDKGIEGSQALLDYSLKASFLEVYGEDVYDLLDANRSSLPLREDSKGGIVVVGLKNRSISNTTEALQVLHEGTMNRTTAATLMNHTSSRSHAVFTIHLSQVTRLNAGDSSDVTTTSQFTFVDLAGSERMKKTGAEGERAREGIKINEGLLALGNVINALADEDKVKKEKKIHVPYRQSKLTRLLQDALGGNSQTLFLACVSPSDTNASETLSALNYANRARKIHNAPTKNVDGTSAELERLKNVNRILQFELVKSRFSIGGKLEDRNEIGEIDESLLQRDDVEAYIQRLYEVAGTTMSPNEISPSPSPFTFNVSSKAFINSELQLGGNLGDSKNRNILSQKFDHSILEDINPDEELAILDHLLGLQQHDHEFEKWREQGDLKLKEMDGELEKQETLLLQLRESLKVYHGLRGKYEELMEEVQHLENEKSSLAKQLDRAKTDPTNGRSAAIRKKLESVEFNLSRARRETLNHRQKQRHAEDQSRKCKVLKRKVNELKHAKLSLLKKQKEDAARYKKTTEAKTKELVALKRRANNTDKRMSKLENELNIQKKNYSKRTQYCTKLSEKLKNTEKHLVKLLALRQSDLSGRTVSIMQRAMKRGDKNTAKSEGSVGVLSEEEIKTTKYVFDRMVVDKVKQRRLKKKYEDLVATYSETMRRVVSEVKALKQARGRLNDGQIESENELTLIKDMEENIVDLEFKLELLDSELQDISVQMPDNMNSSEQNIEDAVGKLLKGMSSSTLRSILLETFSKFVVAEVRHIRLHNVLELDQAGCSHSSFFYLFQRPNARI
jgi:kinesin family protein 4/21/27